MLSTGIRVVAVHHSTETAAKNIIEIFVGLKNEIFDFIGALVNLAVAPLIALGLFVYMLFQIAMIVSDKNKGEDISDKMRGLCLTATIFALVIAYGLMFANWTALFK